MTIGNSSPGAAFPVPAQDSADNNNISDAIGNKTDTHSGDSLHAKTAQMLEHIHKPSLVYPTLAAGVTLTCGNAASWTLGAFVEIIPASTVTKDFDLHFVSIEDLSANTVFEIHFFFGASDTFCGSCRVTKNAVFDGTLNAPVQTFLIPANSRIRAKIASATGNADTADISVFYHTY